MHSHATPTLATISSIVTVLLLICLTSKACAASSQKQQQQQTSATGPNQNGELLRQLLTLTASNQQQQQPQQLEEAAQGAAAKPSKKQVLFEAKYANADKADQKKLALKLKLHKLVDEIVDESVESEQARGKSAFAQKQQAREQDQDEGLVLVMKRRPLSDNNELGDLFVSQQQQQQPRRLTSEHARNILDDGFGIRRDSVFTTNNHLGMKGVPKFGSDEQF